MDAIILAGGFGTRLKECVADRPKPMALIDKTPFLDILIHQIRSYKQIKKIVLAIGYMAEFIQNYYQNQSDIAFSIEDKPLGTGGAIKLALSLATSQNVLVMNGDSYIDFSFETLKKFHEVNKSDCTLLYTETDNSKSFGSLKIDQNSQRILAFNEKISLEKGFINAGVYLIKKDLFENLDLTEAFSIEKEAFPILIKKKKVFGLYSSQKVLDIGTKESYLKAPEILKKLKNV
ncbi:MAG: NTP transferase domain-containing protein [Chlamydiae bacterium]|nr:NTP transferase domain-containing protein [Chlamydiota bacterium]